MSGQRDDSGSADPRTTRNTDTLNTAVVVIGGGPAGLSMACVLAAAGVPVVCLDRDPPQVHNRSGFDIRTTALALCAKRILDGCGVWPKIEADSGPILDIRVADGGSPLFVHYDHRDVGAEPMGWIIDNADLRRGLFERVAELPALTHLTPATVAHLHRDGGGVTVALTDGRTITAQLAIAADGRGSLCRREAGIATHGWSYGQTAIVCTLRHERPHRGVAVELFLPTGPFAMLPMTGNRTSIVWSENSRRAPMYLDLPEDEFLYELRRRTGDWLGGFEVIGGRAGRAAWPLSIMLAERFIDRRLALIGEAAHAIHPIAGQGLNLSMRDIAALAEAIVDRHRLGLDVGADEVLERFQRWRRFDTVMLAGVCDGLVHLFSNTLAPVRLARSLGLGAVNQIPPLKRFLMRHAMGVVGDLPRLIRGESL